VYPVEAAPLKFTSSENECADTLFAGAVRPGAALFVSRVRESRRYRAIRGPETWRIVGENRALGVDVGEDAARAPLACLYGESTVY